eukprot:1152851-Pelagomonas_calceolata.AAC.1
MSCPYKLARKNHRLPAPGAQSVKRHGLLCRELVISNELFVANIRHSTFSLSTSIATCPKYRFCPGKQCCPTACSC